MLLLIPMLHRSMPQMTPSFEGSYRDLITSLAVLVGRHAQLRRVSLSAALQFGSFSLFWTTMVFHLEAMPGDYSATTAGWLALIGATGVLAALAVGRFSDRVPPRKLLLAGGGLLLVSFALLGLAGNRIFWMVPAVVMLDLGMQVSHVVSMSLVLRLETKAASRLNTVYMVTRFLGGACGTVVASLAWSFGEWPWICIAGAAMNVSALLLILPARALKRIAP